MTAKPAWRLRYSKFRAYNFLGILALLLVSLFHFLLVDPVYAATPFTAAALVHARLQTSIAASTTGNFILIAVKTTASEAGGQTTAVVTFGAGYTVNATAANITVVNPGSSSCPTTYDITGTGVQATLTNWPGVGTAASSVSGQQVTFASTALSASTVYGFCITGGITNPSSTGQQLTTITANNDSTGVATYFISGDQVTVNATVPQTFTFTLSGTTDNFTGNLSTASVTSTSGITATVITNAATGYSIQVKDSNQGIKSTVANYTITSANSGSITTLSNNSEGYVLAITSKTTNNTGTAAVATKFDDTGGSGNKGGDLHTASYQEIAYGNKSTSSDAYTFKERSTISGTTPAASDYTDIITVVASGNF